MLKLLISKILLKVPTHPRRQIYQMLSLLAMAFMRPIAASIKPTKLRIVIFDHRLSGNLKGFLRSLKAHAADVDIAYMPTDIKTFNAVSHDPSLRILDRLSLGDMLWAVNAHVFLTSIYARRFITLLRRINRRIRLVQVFHTIPVLPETVDWYRNMGSFDRVLCASDWIADELFAKHGVPQHKLRATGFAGLDALAKPQRSREAICSDFALDPNKPIVLFAPTLSATLAAQGGSHFDLYAHLDNINQWAETHDVQFVIRSHPHDTASTQASYSHIHFRSGADYPNANEQLAIADMMIADRSGIAVYYCTRLRPIVFIHCDLAIQENQRSFFSYHDLPGPEVRTINELLDVLNHALLEEDNFFADYLPQLSDTRARAFGNTLDGNSGLRYLDEIHACVGDITV